MGKLTTVYKLVLTLAGAMAVFTGGITLAADKEYPSLTIKIIDDKSFKTLPYTLVAIDCGSTGTQCQSQIKCKDVVDWNTPRFGVYRPASGVLHLTRIGDGINIISYNKDAPFSQNICIKLWKDGYETLITEKNLGPNHNSFEIYLKPETDQNKTENE